MSREAAKRRSAGERSFQEASPESGRTLILQSSNPPTLQPSTPPISQSPNLPISQSPNLPISHLLCWLLILVFAIYFSVVSVQQHYAFQTDGLDVGNVDQALWNTAHGRFLQFTLMTPIESRLALHVEPILLLLAPFYWLNLGGPVLLLIVQAVVVALGAWPLYRIAGHNLGRGAALPGGFARRQGSRGDSVSPPLLSSPAPLLILPLSYLLFPPLQSAVFFEFHAVTLAPTFFLWAFWALERAKVIRFLVFIGLAMVCKEDMPLVAAMVGLAIGLNRRHWRLAGVTIGLSLIWFVIAFLVIQPRFAIGGNIQLERYAWLGDSPPAMLQTVATQPGLVFDRLWYRVDLLDYLGNLFFPTAFLALFSPLTLLPLLPTLAVNLLSDNPFSWRLEDFHYGAPLASFLFLSAIYGIAWLAGKVSAEARGSGGAGEQPFQEAPRGSGGAETFFSQSPNLSISQSPQSPHLSSPPSQFTIHHSPFTITPLLLLLLTFTLVYHYYRGYTPLARPFQWPEVTAHHQQLKTLLRDIPADAPVFTQSNIAPHLSQRRVLYTDFGYFTDPDFPAPVPVDEIVLDITSFENSGGLHQFLRQKLLESGEYEMVSAHDGILHLRSSSVLRPSPSVVLPPSFHTFAQPSGPLDYSLAVDFGHVLRLHGYSLHFNRQEEVQITLDLEALQPLNQAQPVIYLVDAAGRLTGATTDLQPGLVWYAPEQWPVGEIVRLRFNTFPWHTRETRQYGLALGVVGGDDVWNIDHRYQPAVIDPTPLALRRPANGTTIQLAQIEQLWRVPQGGPPLRRFTIPRPPQHLKANFDHQIQLLGHTLPQVTHLPSPISQPWSAIPWPGQDRQDKSPNLPTLEIRPGQVSQSPSPPVSQSPNLSISLYWQAFTRPSQVTRFVQFVGLDGQVYGQNDSIPDRGLYPTDLWQPGEVVIETVTFPVRAERPPGSYRLHLGFYDPETGHRLPLVTGGDHIEIDVRGE